MHFSDKFNVTTEDIENYGAIDISLVCDIPLFIDPMLIFGSNKPEYIALNEEIVNYFNFLYDKAKEKFSKGDIKTYLNFSEIANNWLGYSQKGNKGKGSGTKFAKFFSENLEFINNSNNISNTTHIEKSLLLYDGNGKDKISDMTTNLILRYLANYTQTFASQYINKSLLDIFPIDCGFNYETGTPYPETFILPFIINEKGLREFVLLTPRDILRAEEPGISLNNFKHCSYQIRRCIDNDILRTQLNNYISVRLAQYIDECKKNERKPSDRELACTENRIFIEAAKEFPWVYDYFIKYVEQNGNEIKDLSKEEVDNQIKKFYKNSSEFIDIFKETYGKVGIPNSREELLNRLTFFKHCIEDCDCYKLLYDKNNNKISTEDDLERFFRFVWYGTIFDINTQGNNGRGEYDVKVSFDAKDKTIAEMKLATNPHLKAICEQTEVYEKASMCTKDSIYVIFYFTAEEKTSLDDKIRNSKNKTKILKNVIFIDCRTDNKPSGSKVVA